MIEIIQAIFQPKIIAILMVFSIPLSAIIGGFYFNIQKLKLKQGGSKLSEEEVKLLKETLSQNQQLTERVSNLETVIMNLDQELTLLKGYDIDSIKVKELAKNQANKH
ncbi:MAG: hypothetical protein MUE81_03665 [Thermoflexibacter sp.]|jgi:uncharacterized membrane protein YraQ (UPF0718 family)|nr:hypothetical protein [Thermoflexibacter sp.]